MTVASPHLDSEDLYERLGVERSASTEDVKRAYRALLRRYTPEQAEEQFKRIREAYETLVDPSARKEYDEQPSESIRDGVAAALRAMEEEDYVVAERQLKRVLLEAPDLAFARNFLALCFIYQEEPARAIDQLQRILQLPEAHSAWFGNAGHAYRALGQLENAERAFREAIRRSSDTRTEYYIGLADVFVAANSYDKAAFVLEEGITADGIVDYQDARCFASLLDVRILQDDLSGTTNVLRRMVDVAVEPDQRTQMAVRLGLRAKRLILAGLFPFAERVARTARILDPDDPDYDALVSISLALRTGNIVAARSLLGEHESFEEDGWLSDLVPDIARQLTDRALAGGMTPLESAPSMQTINGIGTRLYGKREKDARTESYVSTLYFVFFFIPLLPLSCYRVRDAENGGWYFLGKTPLSVGQRHYRSAVFILVLIWVLALVIEQAGVPRDSGRAEAPIEVATTHGAAISRVDEVTPTLPSSPVAPQPAKESFREWYRSEVARIRVAEADIEVLDARLAVMEETVDSYAAEITAVRDGYGAYSRVDSRYDGLIARYRKAVDDYDTLFERRDQEYERYLSALDEFNARVEVQNARRR